MLTALPGRNPNFTISPAELPLGSYSLFPTKNETAEGIHVTSNDGVIVEEAVNALQSKKGGLALHIGAGAMFSLAPHHELHPVIIDRDAKVLQFQMLLESVIRRSTDATMALQDVAESGAIMLDQRQETVKSMLQTEASKDRQGEIHWLHNFTEVRQAITDRPPTYVLADITDPKLHRSITAAAKSHGKIELFNATNVHDWIKGRVDFVNDLPFSTDPIILYSSRKHLTVGKPLPRMTANSVGEYISAVAAI